MPLQSLTLQTNVGSLRAQRNLLGSEKILNTSMGRLSSGMRINMAADDAAGLAISEKLRSQIRSLAQAQRNANDGVSMLQTAEGALNEISGLLTRMRELSIQGANATLGNAERLSIDDEFDALVSEVNRIAAGTEFNGQDLIDGDMSGGMTFQVGINNVAANDRITVTLSGAQATVLGISTTTTLSTVAGARNAIARIDTAISNVNSRRGDIGAAQNRLFTTVSSLSAAHENLSSANSRIRDTDVASESANFTRGQILMQAGVSILAQANQLPGMALSLIG